MSMRFQYRPRAAAVSALAFLCACSLAFTPQAFGDTVSSGSPTPALQNSLMLQLQDEFTAIARSAVPYVVNIKASRTVSSGSKNPTQRDSTPPSIVPPTSPVPHDDSPFPRRMDATGSGVLVSPDGYIITNDHVVEGSKVVTVTLSDGREYYGSVLEDHQSDLAVVKIDAPNVTFPCCKFADSDKVETGQWSIAIGSPFDLRNTMTVGFISATHRKQIIPSLASARFYPDLIQTDAAINPGNSGGPLFDANGEVVGINVAIESSVDSSAGIGFAIPANFAKSIMQQLIKNGKVTRGYLGITPAELTPAKQEIYGVNAGSWVQEVDSDSPAGRAGIHAGDIIESFAGKPVDGELSLRMAIMQEAPGESAAINLIRNGKPLSYSVVLAAPPQIPTAESGVASTPPIDQKKIGVSVRNLTDSDRDQDKLSPDTVGALVTNVLLNSPAEQAGLLPGDIITHIGKHEIKTALDAANALNELVPGKEMIMIVLHSTAPGKTLEIALDLKTWK